MADRAETGDGNATGAPVHGGEKGTDGAEGIAETAGNEGEATGGSVLARVPEAVIPLGAGSLATATLLTLAGAGFIAYSIATGQFYGYQPYQIFLAGFQFSVATIAQVIGVHFARQRVRWTWVMIAGALGTLTFIALPFSVLALVCLGLGKYHFSSHTPQSVIAGEDA